MKQYLIWLWGGLLAVMALLMTINLIVDPLNLFRLVDIAGINAEKTRQSGSGMRVPKSVYIARHDIDHLLLGSSRVEVGLNPKWSGFEGMAYNAGLSDSNIAELLPVGQLTLARDHPPRDIVIGLDFKLFSNEQTVLHDFDLSAFSGLSWPLVVAQNLMSRKVTSLSLKTVRENRKGKKARYDDFGHLPQPRVLPPQGHRLLFIHLLHKGTYGRFEYDVQRVRDFSTFLEVAHAQNIRIHLYISPVHIWESEAFRQLGLYGAYEQWKRDLASALIKVNDNINDAQAIKLWDFSGVNDVTTEVVPEMGNQTPMQWYWESSHFKVKTGNLILAKLYDRADVIPQNHQGLDFGQVLDLKNIEGHLQTQRDSLKSYILERPDIALQVKSMVRGN